MLAADVLWVSSQHGALLATVCALLARAPHARFLLVAGFHTGRPAIARFLAAARAAGLVPASDAPFGGVYERSIFGERRAWQGSAANDDGEEEMGDIGERAQWVVVASLTWATPAAPA